jgi:hypothetical protein
MPGLTFFSAIDCVVGIFGYRRTSLPLNHKEAIQDLPTNTTVLVNMQFISPTIAGYHLAWRFIAFVWVCM